MFRNNIVILIGLATLVFAIEIINGEVKKSGNELHNSDSYENGNENFDEKRKRSLMGQSDLESKNQLLREYLDRLVQKYKVSRHGGPARPMELESNDDFDGGLDGDDDFNPENRYGNREDSDENASDENDDESEFENRKKKLHMKKKRFRAMYRKRNALNRLKKFRSNF